VVHPNPIYLAFLEKEDFGHSRSSRADHVMRQQECGHLQAKERRLRGNQLCCHLDLLLEATITYKKRFQFKILQSVVLCYGSPTNTKENMA
jgi:hypothetical protein